MHYHKYWIYQNIWQTKSIKFIIKLYADNNTKWVKHATHLKDGALRTAFLSKSNFQRGQQQLYLPYKLCRILSKMVGFSAFSQPYLCIQQSLQSPPKTLSSTWDNFHLPILPLLFSKIILTIPLCRSNFSPPCFCIQSSQLSTPKIFFLPHPFSQFSYGVLIFSFFPKVWTVLSGFTITDFLLLRIRKLIYCR